MGLSCEGRCPAGKGLKTQRLTYLRVLSNCGNPASAALAVDQSWTCLDGDPNAFDRVKPWTKATVRSSRDRDGSQLTGASGLQGALRIGTIVPKDRRSRSGHQQRVQPCRGILLKGSRDRGCWGPGIVNAESEADLPLAGRLGRTGHGYTWPDKTTLYKVVHPALHNKNLLTFLNGREIVLAARHSKVRRLGYSRG